MQIRTIVSPEDFARYRAPNLWQSPAWKRFQESLGREVRVYVAEDGGDVAASALVVIDKTAFGCSTWNIPRGPAQFSGGGVALSALLDHIVHDAKREACLCVYVSPTTPLEAPRQKLAASARHEQPEATRIIDLTKSDDAILAQMKPKGRYNISVAKRHGIRVEENKDIDAFSRLLRETAGRDGFTPHAKRHYEAFLSDLEGGFLLMAYAVPENEGNPPKAVAGLLGVVWDHQGIYYYGASDHTHRATMAPYLLQWEAMRRCKRLGCTAYDLLGIAPVSDANAPQNDLWAGISAFKEKFGGNVTLYPPEKQIVLRPVMLQLLNVKRRFWG